MCVSVASHRGLISAAALIFLLINMRAKEPQGLTEN